MDDKAAFAVALKEAKKGFSVGGLPIGACLVSKDGKILGQGHNKRVHIGSVIMHVCYQTYYQSHRGATMYTTLITCVMCTGACLLYGIGRVVYGTGAGQKVAIDTVNLLESHGIETKCMEVDECQEMIKENPDKYKLEPWAE